MPRDLGRAALPGSDESGGGTRVHWQKNIHQRGHNGPVLLGWTEGPQWELLSTLHGNSNSFIANIVFTMMFSKMFSPPYYFQHMEGHYKFRSSKSLTTRPAILLPLLLSYPIQFSPHILVRRHPVPQPASQSVAAVAAHLPVDNPFSPNRGHRLQHLPFRSLYTPLQLASSIDLG